ncbi:MAG: DegT/DnrJ/EryC1/StrS family aminotransferase [Treponema sp.]|jgi:dTDP-4-amino-4,6-dideoxygalactose transaminase|nr:DegT/DnrJ/EryC1/StrS family aminotransferase [Treponema sp.]
MKIEIYSPTIKRKEMDAVLTAMVEDKIGPGEQARSLIQLAKEYLGFECCLALRSPAIALFFALRSLGLEPDQGVVISALSPGYYVKVLEDLRLRPVYADVGTSSACVDRATLDAALSGGDSVPRCIVIHHTLGYVPDMASIVQIGLPVIEDISQSYGTVLKESKPGSFGVFTILGLEERDMLTAGGGALLYSVHRRDGAVLKNLGELPPEYGLPDMNAAMAAVQFREGLKNLEKRKEIAQVYVQSSLRTRHKRFIQQDDVEYNNYAFPLILETGMKDVKAYAKRKEIEVESAFDATVMGVGIVESKVCPESYSLFLRTVLFPLYPRLRAAEIEKVAKLIATLP